MRAERGKGLRSGGFLFLTDSRTGSEVPKGAEVASQSGPICAHEGPLHALTQRGGFLNEAWLNLSIEKQMLSQEAGAQPACSRLPSQKADTLSTQCERPHISGLCLVADQLPHQFEHVDQFLHL